MQNPGSSMGIVIFGDRDLNCEQRTFQSNSIFQTSQFFDQVLFLRPTFLRPTDLSNCQKSTNEFDKMPKSNFLEIEMSAFHG